LVTHLVAAIIERQRVTSKAALREDAESLHDIISRSEEHFGADSSRCRLRYYKFAAASDEMLPGSPEPARSYSIEHSLSFMS
jgi:ribosomal protein S24E